MKHNILIISFDYPPSSGAGSVRAYQVANYFSKKDFEVSVVYEPQIRDDISDYSYFKYHIENCNLCPTANIKTNKFVKSILKILPANAGWLLKALTLVGKNKTLQNNEFIYCIGYPFVAHIIGIFYKIKYARSKLIVDFVDPWSLHPGTYKKKQSLYYKAYATVFETISFLFAERVYFSNRIIKERYIDKYSWIGRDEIFSHFIYGASGDRIPQSAIHKDAAEFTIGWIGNIQGMQNIDELVEGLHLFLSKTSSCKINWVGKSVTEDKNDISKLTGLPNINYKEYIPNSELSAFLESNDINIMMLHNGFQTPSKLAAYICASPPVLCIYNHLPEESVDIVNQEQKGICVQNNRFEIQNALEQLHALYKENRMRDEYPDAVREKYHWANILEEAMHPLRAGRDEN